MPIKSYAGLEEIIITKLEALEGADSTDLFAGVYDILETEPEGYPCAYVVPKTGGGQIIDTHRNEREWQFDIFLHVEINANRTPSQAKDALYDAADRVIEAFDQNSQAQCKWVRVVPTDFLWGVQNGAFHEAKLVVAIVDIVNRYVEP